MVVVVVGVCGVILIQMYLADVSSLNGNNSYYATIPSYLINSWDFIGDLGQSHDLERCECLYIAPYHMVLHASIHKWAYPDDVIKTGELPTLELSPSATPTSGTHPCFMEVLPIGYVGIGCYGDVFPGQRVWFHLV